MNDQKQEQRSPSVRDGWAEARTTCSAVMPSKRIEQETQLLIKYINDELVPAIRDHSSNALRIASEKLTQAADLMDSTKQKKG